MSLLLCKKKMKKKDTQNKISRGKVYLVVLAANMLYVPMGSIFSWLVTYQQEPRLGKTQFLFSPIKLVGSDEHINEELIFENIGCLLLMGAIVGSWFSIFLMVLFGRKNTLVINMLNYTIAWGLWYSENSMCFYIASVIGGIAVGCTLSSVPLYIVEVCDDKIREVMLSTGNLHVAIGFFAALIFSQVLDSSVTVSVFGTVPIIGALLMAVMPESPYYLINCNRHQEAVRVVRYLRGHPTLTLVENEVRRIEDDIVKSKIEFQSCWGLFKKGGIPRQALQTSLSLLSLAQTTGVTELTNYTLTLIKAPTGQPSLVFFIKCALLGACTMVSAFASSFVIKAFGTRRVLVFCTTMTGLMLFGIGIFMRYRECDDQPHIELMLHVSIILYYTFFCIGVSLVPWGVVSQLFPPSVQYPGIALSCSSSATTALLVIIANDYLMINECYMFMMLGLSTMGGGMGVLKLLPENMRIPLADIQTSLMPLATKITTPKDNKERDHPTERYIKNENI